MNALLPIFFISFILGSCGEPSPPTSKRQMPPGDPIIEKTKGDPKLGLGLSIRELSRSFSDSKDDDALSNTMAVLAIQASLTLDGETIGENYPEFDNKVKLESESVVLLRSKSADTTYDITALSNADKQVLGDLCRDSFLSVDNNFSSLANASNESSLSLSEFTIAWRSHHPQSLLEDVGLLLLDQQIEARCALKVTPKWEGSEISKPYLFSFSFSPSKKSGVEASKEYRGTDSSANFDSAIEASVMLLEVKSPDWDYNEERWQILSPPPASSDHTRLERSIAAINPSSLSIASPISDGSTCYYYEDSLLPTAPNAEQDTTFEIVEAGMIAFTIDAVSPATAENRCADISASFAEKKITLNYTCQAYKTVADASPCNFLTTVSNSLDPRNSLIYPIEPPVGDFYIIEAGGPEESIAFLPKHANNPIRGVTPTISLIPGPISSQNFDAAQKEVVAKAFDLWLGTHAGSFENYVQGQVTKIQYNTVADTPACANAGGWAYVGGGPSPDTFYWCDIGGGLSKDLINNHSASAHATIYRAALVLHESLHVSGQFHDADPAIVLPATRLSCTPDIGTAYSGIIAYSIFQCAQADDPLRPFCVGLADQAKAELKNELEYSLKESEGILTQTNIDQCEDWANEMGVLLAL